MLEEAQTPGVMSVELLACALAQLPLQHLESLVLVRYAEGEYFSEHHDGGFRPKTVLLYLNGEHGSSPLASSCSPALEDECGLLLLCYVCSVCRFVWPAADGQVFAV